MSKLNTILEELNYRDRVLSLIINEGFVTDEMRKAKDGKFEREPQNDTHRIITFNIEDEVEKHKETYLRLSLGDMCYDNKDYVIARLFGGRNGGGEWKLYWAELYQFIKELQGRLIHKEDLNTDRNYFLNVWLIDLINDCADDVFDMIIGVGLR
jgi:hypothetical protein